MRRNSTVPGVGEGRAMVGGNMNGRSPLSSRTRRRTLAGGFGVGVELAARGAGAGSARPRGGAGGAGSVPPGVELAARRRGGASFALSGRVDCARPRGKAGGVSAPPGAGPASRCLAESTARGPEAEPVASVPHTGAGPAPCRLGQSRPRFSTMSKIVLDKMCPNPHDAGLILPYFAPSQRKFAKEFYIFPGKSLVVFIILIRGCG